MVIVACSQAIDTASSLSDPTKAKENFAKYIQGKIGLRLFPYLIIDHQEVYKLYLAVIFSIC